MALKGQERTYEAHRSTLESKLKQLSDLARTAKSDRVRVVYEKQIEEVACELENIPTRATDKTDLDTPYRTALGKVNKLLKSPYKIWRNVDTREKHNLFYFIFDERLCYGVKSGYRTDKLPTAARLFEEFATANPLDVEMPGIEPGCNRHASNDSTAVARFGV